MNFLNILVRAIGFVPSLVSSIESLYAGKSGAEKKDAAMTFLENALQTVDTFAQRDVVDAVKFREGISKVIDGTVECLNASAWAKNSPQPSTVSRQ